MPRFSIPPTAHVVILKRLFNAGMLAMTHEQTATWEYNQSGYGRDYMRLNAYAIGYKGVVDVVRAAAIDNEWTFNGMWGQLDRMRDGLRTLVADLIAQEPDTSGDGVPYYDTKGSPLVWDARYALDFASERLRGMTEALAELDIPQSIAACAVLSYC